jgi:hypothetical protein
MLTKKDFFELTQIFATKDELKQMEDRMIGRFDAVMYELQSGREDRAALVYRNSEHFDKLENHEKRLIKLETE